MDVDCEGCAGCCVDWHALAPDGEPAARTGPRRPLDDASNFVPLEREEVRAFLEAGLGDALTPRLWTVERERGSGRDRGSGRERGAGSRDDAADSAVGGGSASDGGERDPGSDGGRAEPAAVSDPEDRDPRRADGLTEVAGGTVAIDGYRLAAANGRPVFYLGLRKPRKPVAPFGREESVWLPTCAFLDPETLQCRIHDAETYPAACAAYPGYNLLLEQETECERVEAAFGGERLRDEAPSTDLAGVGLGPQALGAKLFAHPEPETLAGRVDRIARGDATDEDRATFVAVGAASSPGTLAIAEERREDALERALAADSWVGRAIAEWTERSGAVGSEAGAASGLGEAVEVARGAPETPGWD